MLERLSNIIVTKMEGRSESSKNQECPGLTVLGDSIKKHSKTEPWGKHLRWAGSVQKDRGDAISNPEVVVISKETNFNL